MISPPAARHAELEQVRTQPVGRVGRTVRARRQQHPLELVQRVRPRRGNVADDVVEERERPAAKLAHPAAPARHLQQAVEPVAARAYAYTREHCH